MATVPLHVPTGLDAGDRRRHRAGRRRSVDDVGRKPLGAASAALIVVLVLTAIFADVLAPYDPLETQPEIRLPAPSRAHPFGTDDIGRDVLSRIIYGARISLWVGLLAVGIGTVAGMVIGLALRLLRGAARSDRSSASWTRSRPSRGSCSRWPSSSVLKPNTTNAMLAIAMVIIPGNSRIVRGAVLSAKQNRYVEAAQALGCRHPRIILTPHPAQRDRAHPDHRVDLARQRDPHRGDAVASSGVGTQPPTPSWGLMLSSTGRAFMEQAPWLAIFPGLAISLAVLGFNLFGDTLRDAWDPKLRRNG